MGMDGAGKTTYVKKHYTLDQVFIFNKKNYNLKANRILRLYPDQRILTRVLYLLFYPIELIELIFMQLENKYRVMERSPLDRGIYLFEPFSNNKILALFAKIFFWFYLILIMMKLKGSIIYFIDWKDVNCYFQNRPDFYNEVDFSKRYNAYRKLRYLLYKKGFVIKVVYND